MPEFARYVPDPSARQFSGAETTVVPVGTARVIVPTASPLPMLANQAGPRLRNPIVAVTFCTETTP